GQDVRLPPVQPYRDYILWLQRQDQAKAEAFWRQTLAGFTAPTPLGITQTSWQDHPAGYLEQEACLPADGTAALQQLARQLKVTLNTLVLGSWALLLGRYSGAAEVVVGVTVSGRPPGLPGVETMVGLFINTLPVRVRVPPAEE